MKNIIFLGLLIFSQLLWAIPEERFNEVWPSRAVPYFDALEKGDFINSQGLKIRYHKLFSQDHHKTLVIMNGRTEPSLKYAELIYDLKASGANIFIMDHQGQGESDHLLNDPQKGHVRYFIDYIRDMEQFLNEIVLPEISHKPVLLAHSMGGAISVHYLARNKTVFHKAVLISPMLEINTAPYSEFVARIYSKLLVTIGKGHEYAPGEGPYLPDEDQFETNALTHSRVRFLASKYIFTTYPEQSLGGPTARWVHTSLVATKNIHKLKTITPILMFQAGEDEIVKLKRQDQFCQRASCEMVKIEKARHELLMEEDSIRKPVLRKLRSFLGI